MFGGLLAATIGAPLIGSVIGNIASSDDRDKAQQAAQQAYAQIQQLGAGPDLAKQIYLQKFQQAGVYSPELEKAVTQQTSQVSGIQNQSPELQQAQMGALQQFQQLGQTGLSATDRAALAQIQQQNATAQQGKIAQIQNQMASQGMGGSGADLAARLSVAQQGANQQSSDALQVGAQAQQARLAALAQQANQASQITGQQFNMNLQKAQAADELARFNVQQQSAAQQRNVANQNAAAQYNINNAQTVGNANVQNANQLALMQPGLQQQMYQNQVQRAQLGANALLGQSGMYNQQAQNTAQGWSNIGSGLGSAAGAIGSARGDSLFGTQLAKAAGSTPATKPRTTDEYGFN